MRMPGVTEIPQKIKKQIIEFKGVNYTDTIQDGELIEAKNITTDYFPCLAPRESRETVKTLTASSNILNHGGKLAYVDGTNFYYDGAVKGQVTAGNKHIAIMNDYVCIMPDKKAYDTINNKFETMEKYVTSDFAEVEPSVTIEGRKYCQITIGPSVPANFKVGEAVSIQGMLMEENNKTAVIKAYHPDYDNALLFDENTFSRESNMNQIKIGNMVPDNLKFIVEHNNRMWGCNDKNEIFASKLGDHTSWYCFQGLASDSYGASVGSDGVFTGAVSFNNVLTFFKEDAIYKLYGDKPANFQVIANKTDGVRNGCYFSIAQANNLLYFVSKNGVYSYDGGIPYKVSLKLGNISMLEAAAGSVNDKYYLSFKNEATGKYNLYTYDTRKGMWMLQDETQVKQFTTMQGELYYINATNQLIKVNSGNENIRWEATLGRFHEYLSEKKITSKLQFITELEPGSTVEIQISYDGKDYTSATKIDYAGLKTGSCMIRPTRCSYFNIKIIGEGKAKVLSVARDMIIGSDV